MQLNVLIFVLLFGLIQGSLIIAVLLARKKVELFHIFLCAYITALLVQLVFKLVSKIWLMQNFTQPYSLSYYLPLLYGPLIFLFAKHYLNQRNGWSWKDLLHFIPFSLYLVAIAFAEPTKSPFIDSFFGGYAASRLFFQLVSLVVYHFAVLVIWRKEKESANNALHTRRIFLYRFAVVSFSVTSCIAVALYFLYTRFPHYQDIRWAFALLTVFIYWLSFEALKKPELFRVVLGNARSPVNAKPASEYSIPSYLKVHHTKEKYAHSSLKEEESKRILAALDKMMDKEKIYLDAEVNIDKIADKISCRKHHLSQVLNEKLKKSFNDLLNEKRIEEAKTILSDSRFNHFKISSVAFDTGFKSLSSFNEIFKKRKGITPSQFRIVSQQDKNRSQVSRI